MGMLPSFGGVEAHASCAIYARVSTKRQAEENTSIDVQLHLARKFAAERGWTIYAEYVDPGASGRSDKGRPQFNAMIAQALSPAPPFTVILVYDHSRFYRNAGQSGTTRQALRLNGVEVRSITQPIRDDGLSGSLAIDIQAAVDQNHSAITAMKVREGMAASAREGFYVGGTVPFGYCLEMVEKRGKKIKNRLAIQEEEAQVVRYIFELYTNGLGIKSITAKLNSEKRYNRGGKPWYHSVLGRILSAPTYVGRHSFKPTDWQTKKTLPRTEWIDIPCPALVDQASFDLVQKLLKQRHPRMTPPRETTSDVLLAKIAQCGSCGAPLQKDTGTSRNGEVYDYYKCAKKLNLGFCPGGNPISISRTYLEELVLGKLADELFTAERIQEITSKAAQMQSNEKDAAMTRAAQLKRQLAAARRKESNLWDLAADQGLGARGGFKSKLDAVEQEILSLENLLSAQEALIQNSVKGLEQAGAHQASMMMRKLLFEADVKLKKRFLGALIDKVIVKNDVIEIVGTEVRLAACANAANDSAPPRFASLTAYGGR